MHSTLAFAPTPEDLEDSFFDRPVLSLRPVTPPPGPGARGTAQGPASGTAEAAPAPAPRPPGG